MPYNLEPYNVPESHAYGKCRLVTDFEKISYIGEGAYGSVFKCKDKKYDLIVALKKLRIRHEDRPLPRNFMREITIMKELQHDNVATLIGIAVGRNFASTYLILEYYPYDLSKIIDDAVAKPFILHPELLYGLDYIHHHNVLHRDLALTLDVHVSLVQKMKEMTPNKVSRWYRAPELLFGDTKYTSAIDI
ncbi:cell division control protein 2 homolog, partial [Trichonephila clavata]